MEAVEEQDAGGREEYFMLMCVVYNSVLSLSYYYCRITRLGKSHEPLYIF